MFFLFLLFFISLPAWSVSLDAIAPGVTFSVELTLKNQVQLQSPIIYLSDIATCVSEVDVCHEIYGIEVAAAPEIYKIKEISANDLRALLKKEWPRAQALIRGSWSNVKLEPHLLTEEVLLNGVKAAFAASFIENHNQQVNIISIIYPKSIKVSYPSGDLSCLEDRASKLKLDSIEASCRYKNINEKTDGPFQVKAAAIIKQKVFLSAQSFEKGDSLTENAIYQDFREIKFSKDELLTDPSIATSMKLSKSILKDTVLTKRLFYEAKPFKKGQKMDLIFSGSGFTIKSKGTLLMDGQIEDILTFELEGSKKQVQAKIKDKHLAFIER